MLGDYGTSSTKGCRLAASVLRCRGLAGHNNLGPRCSPRQVAVMLETMEHQVQRVVDWPPVC